MFKYNSLQCPRKENLLSVKYYEKSVASDEFSKIKITYSQQGHRNSVSQIKSGSTVKIPTKT